MYFYYERYGQEWQVNGECFLLDEICCSLEKDFCQTVTRSSALLSNRYDLKPFQIHARTSSVYFQKGIAQSLARELIEGGDYSSATVTIIITSEENFVWQSMQEIIPSLEMLWGASSQSNKHEVYYFNVDKNNLKQYLPLFLKAKNIFLTCFNLKIAKTLDILRRRLGIDSRLFIELHNMATIACWPFHEWGLGETFKSSDIFISTCCYDRDALKLVYPEGKCELFPFSAIELDKVPLKKVFKSSTIFAYVGRISVQKNLQTLLASLNLLEDQDFECHIYGAEDGLGSPNMEDYPEKYLDYLKDLACDLGLEKRVYFKGHYPRAKLYEELHDPNVILVSPSLHSDENFGMALFRGLLSGQRIVCSDWGGHGDFVKYFPKQTVTVPVFETAKGPQLSPFDFKIALEKSLKLSCQNPFLPEYYDQKNLSRKIQDLATASTGESVSLERSTLANSIHKKRTEYLKDEGNKACKIFQNYSDPLVQPFFKAYGMKGCRRNIDKLVLVPWAQVTEKEILIKDFHRGFETYRLGGEVEIRTWFGEKFKITHKTFQKMWDNGDLFSVIPSQEKNDSRT